MEVVGLISAKTNSLGNDGACMQCDPANNVSGHLLSYVRIWGRGFL